VCNTGQSRAGSSNDPKAGGFDLSAGDKVFRSNHNYIRGTVQKTKRVFKKHIRNLGSF